MANRGMLFFALFSSLFLFITGGDAWWRMQCHAVLGNARIDPIMFPGQPGGHVHTIFGAQSKSIHMFYACLATDTCCRCWLFVFTKDHPEFVLHKLYGVPRQIKLLDTGPLLP